nr:MAG TPA: Protein of unknown function (DUF1642) [Caudoviricetes sp.]
MNKQELIKKYKRLEGVWNAPGAETARQIFLQDLDQLDEPQKVVVPQFVADWIEKSRLKGWDLLSSMCFTLNDKDKKTIKWLHLGENVNIFAHAWLDGYEVEKEKRYRISMPKARNHKNHAQFLCEQDEKIFWCGEWYPFKTKFTRKQLEDDNFGWVFDCEGIEIEEVE